MFAVGAGVLGIASGLLLLGFLVRVVLLLRRITQGLGSVTLVLRAISDRTAPVEGFVDGIGTNVRGIDQAVEQLSLSRGARTERDTDILPTISGRDSNA
jgi:hypothetical protein